MLKKSAEPVNNVIIIRCINGKVQYTNTLKNTNITVNTITIESQGYL